MPKFTTGIDIDVEGRELIRIEDATPAIESEPLFWVDRESVGELIEVLKPYLPAQDGKLSCGHVEWRGTGHCAVMVCPNYYTIQVGP